MKKSEELPVPFSGEIRCCRVCGLRTSFGCIHTADGSAYGPVSWSASPDAVPDGYVQVTIYDDSTDERVATVFGSEANVRLVEQAPALLALLDELRQAIVDCPALDSSDEWTDLVSRSSRLVDEIRGNR